MKSTKTENVEITESKVNDAKETSDVKDEFVADEETEQIEIDDEIVEAENAAIEFRKHGHSTFYQECWKKCKALERYFKFLAEANPLRVKPYYKAFNEIQKKEVVEHFYRELRETLKGKDTETIIKFLREEIVGKDGE